MGEVFPTGKRYTLEGFRKHLHEQQMAHTTAVVYCSAVRSALLRMRSCKAADIIEYVEQNPNAYFVSAWNRFAAFARGKGFDVDDYPRKRRVRAIARIHPMGRAIVSVVSRALKSEFDFTNGCTLRLRHFTNCFGNVTLHPPTGNAVALRPPESQAACLLLKWAWDEIADGIHFGNGPDGDNRLLIPSVPHGSTPLAMSTIVEIARGTGQLQFVRYVESLRQAQPLA